MYPSRSGSGRGARSLPEGRSLAPRERSDCAGAGERSRPHPAESLAGAPKAQIPRNRGATCLRGKPRGHGQVRGEQLADQNEDERDVEQARGGLIGFHVGRLPDEIGERERSHDPPEDPEEKKERVPLQRQERCEGLSSGRDHDRGSEQRGTADGERREKRRPSGEQPKRERTRDQIPVAEVHRQENSSKEQPSQQRSGGGPDVPVRTGSVKRD